MSRLYRTYSNPNLRYSRENNNLQDHYDNDQVFFVVGDRVYVDCFRAASVAYFGEVDFAAGDWVGLVLDMPTGNHDGRVHGKRYFQCDPLHGIFAKPNRVTKMSSPLPNINIQRRSDLYEVFDEFSRPSSTRPTSAMDGASYIYDEDYRSSPTISSLEQKLRSLEKENFGSSTLPSRTHTGILKGTNKSYIGSRAEELNESIKQISNSTITRNKSPSVFEFRPQRTRLENYETNYDNKSTLDLSTKPIYIGERVSAQTGRGEKCGTLRYLGETNFATGEWAGIELDFPEGKNDGSVLGFRYFSCPQNYGLFVPTTRIKRIKTNETRNNYDYNTIRSTLTSPPPTKWSSRSQSVASSSAYSSPDNLHDYESNRVSGIYDNFSTLRLSSSQSHRGSTTSSPRMFPDTPLPASTRTTRGYQPKDYVTPYQSFEYSEFKPKFDDKDIEYQLRRSLSKGSLHGDCKKPLKTQIKKNHQSKAVEFRFTSSKYDGNPIANRTLVYN